MHSFFWFHDNYVGKDVIQNTGGGEMEMTERHFALLSGCRFEISILNSGVSNKTEREKMNPLVNFVVCEIQTCLTAGVGH